MNGLELAYGYYNEFGKPMLEKEFADLLPYLCVAFCGSGSEHYGFDDDVSRDHDFEAGFSIFLPGEDLVDRKAAFRLERAYAKLPNEYGGVRRQTVSPVGGNRNGVLRTADFFLAAVGSPTGELTAREWLEIPDSALAEAVNGVVFFDGYGEVTRIRERLGEMPESIRLKRLAGNLLIMAQAGQYNYNRCLSHGEKEAASLALREFVTASLRAIFLLRGAYLPYYKWSFRALRAMPGTEEYASLLSLLLTGASAREKTDAVEAVASLVICELRDGNLTEAICGDLEKHAYSVNDHVTDGDIRNLHILAGVRD